MKLLTATSELRTRILAAAKQADKRATAKTGGITQPLLAVSVGDPAENARFPLYASAKLDGIRCLKVAGRVVSRRWKPIANHHIRRSLEKLLPDGIDGEIVVTGYPKTKTFQDITSAVMSHEGKPAFEYWAFDYVKAGLDRPFEDRLADLKALKLKAPVRVIPQVLIHDIDELLEFETKCLAEGYEGIMLRDPAGPYKCGRSTLNEGTLLKCKRFEDSEAVVLSLTEKFKNDNVLEADAFGYAKRSTHQAGQVPAGTLGSVTVRDLKSKVVFSIGSGFDDALRKKLWVAQKAQIGRIVKYKFQSVGVKAAPRFPVFLGFRDKRDMGAPVGRVSKRHRA